MVNFLGITECKDYLAVPYDVSSGSGAAPVPIEPPYPALVESHFEWLALLQSVVEYAQAAGHDESNRPFTMIELGAGFGRWLANAAGALRSIIAENGSPARLSAPRLIAVEAEPQHYEWIAQHLADNDIAFDPADLHWAASAPSDGEVMFYCGASAAWWGQEIVRPHRRQVRHVEGRPVGQLRVPALSLTTLLRGLTEVDLIDADIQGAEFEVFSAAGAALDRCVGRIIVATHHREVEASLRDFMERDLRWTCEMDFAGGGINDTPVGPIRFEDGLQVWRNPQFLRRSGPLPAANH